LIERDPPVKKRIQRFARSTHNHRCQQRLQKSAARPQFIPHRTRVILENAQTIL